MDDAQKISILKAAKNIAILGLSPDENKPSNEVARYLIATGYRIIPIYPKGTDILGFRVFDSLSKAFSDEYYREIGHIDILNIFRKSEALVEIANEILLLAHKPKCIWAQLGVHNLNAKRLFTNAGILYTQNCCIATEHKRLFA